MDLIKKYQKIIKGNSDSDTENETEPLMSSSCSSSQSFGTMFKESETEMSESVEKTEASKRANYLAVTELSPTYFHKHLNKNYPFPYEHQDFDVFLNYDNAYDKSPTYAVVSGIYDDSCVKPSKHLDITYADFKTPEKVSSPTNPSIVTIFAVWNTMLGSSLLAISWGLEKAGLFPGIIINIILAGIFLYMAYMLLKVNEKHCANDGRFEVPELCRLLIGRWAEILTKIFSLIVLIGANIVYWILMSNFLYNSVSSLYGYLTEVDATANSTVICPKKEIINFTIVDFNIPPVVSKFDQYWNLYSTVPIILGVLMFPLLNFKHASFFLKFNSLGTVSVAYLLVFVLVKAVYFGVNLPDIPQIFNIKATFGALTGMLSLSYFIHNIIISIMKNNRHQEHNGRDLSIAFGLVTFTYTFIGAIFYISFPLAKYCIEDNILNNFGKYDTMAIIARVLLLFQLCTVFPLLSYMLRDDIFATMKMFLENVKFDEFKRWRVILLNLILVIVCILFACFLPRIGTIIRFTGALSGMVYVFFIPNLLQIYSSKKEKSLTTRKLIFHILIIILGLVNLLCQFVISDE